MNTTKIIEQLVGTVTDIPKEAAIFKVRQYSPDELKERITDFLDTAATVFNLPLHDGVWKTNQTNTLIQLPLEAHATIYHASGAMKLVNGIRTMESLFSTTPEPEKLNQLIETAATKLNLPSFIGPNESLNFERLWQIKAAAADRNQTTVAPVLCRTVGTYRHFAGELPVWGPASVAIKLADAGILDSIIVQVRSITDEATSIEPIIDPEKAANMVIQQINSLTNNLLPDEAVQSQQLRFGYFSLNKRKNQPLLAPVYIATYQIVGQEGSQSYLQVLPATEKMFLPMLFTGESPELRPKQ